jgi:hypothetical protein
VRCGPSPPLPGVSQCRQRRLPGGETRSGYERSGFRPVLAIAIPVYYLCKPPQPQPYDWFPYAALGVVVVSVIYAFVLNRSDPTLGDRVGSIVADE